MTHIFDTLAADWHGFEQHAKHAEQRAVSHITRHPATIDPGTPPAPPPEGLNMSLLASLEDDFAEVRDKVEEFAASKLPAALEDVKKLEGNPVIPVLLDAAHVPASALQWVVEGIQALSAAFPKPGADNAAQGISEPSSDIQAAPAGPVVGGQA